MTFPLFRPFTHQLAMLVGALLLTFAFATTAATPAQAQSTIDQSYNCGAYGGGTYGEQDCLAANENAPTPTVTPTSTGLFPDTGGQIGLWAAIGALILALGLGVYGYSHRSKRIAKGGSR